MSQQATMNSESDRDEDSEVIMLVEGNEIEPAKHLEKSVTLHKAKSEIVHPKQH